MISTFKAELEEFIMVAKFAMEEEEEALKAHMDKFVGTVKWFAQVPKRPGGEVTVRDFFELWAKFAADYDECWEMDHKRRRRQLFEEGKRAKQQAVEEGVSSRAANSSSLGRRLRDRFRKKR